MSMFERVYVYKTYSDDLAYGEESIRIYERQEDAVQALKEDVEDYFNKPLWMLRKECSADDRVEEDYVSINTGDSTIFWIIEPKSVRAPRYYANAIVYDNGVIKRLSTYEVCTEKEAEEWVKSTLKHSGYEVLCSWLEQYDSEHDQMVFKVQDYIPKLGLRIS